MRAPVVQLGLAALVAILLAACNDKPDAGDLLAPRTPSKTYVTQLPPQPCSPRIVLCAMNWNVDVSTGNGVTCSVKMTGQAFCWGDNYTGMLGAGVYSLPEQCTPFGTTATHPCSTKPLLVTGGHSFSAISVGGDHVCAIQTGTGAAFCWGSANQGQLGISTRTPFLTSPTAVGPPQSGAPLTFASISAGGSSTCGITTNALEFCWGAGFGSTPVQPAGAVGTFKSVSVATASSCALDATGNSCNGANSPYVFLGPATTASHFCQIASSAITECWGTNTYGQLGIGNATQTNKVTRVQGPVAFQSVSTGAFHTCALSGAAAFCWGGNQYYELGTGSTALSASSPVAVAVPSSHPQDVKIAAGGGHTCALDNTGGVWCWGLNDVGQVGAGFSLTQTDASAPYASYFAGVAQPTLALSVITL